MEREIDLITTGLRMLKVTALIFTIVLLSIGTAHAWRIYLESETEAEKRCQEKLDFQFDEPDPPGYVACVREEGERSPFVVEGRWFLGSLVPFAVWISARTLLRREESRA